MCLLVLFHKTLPGRPVVICANRDEFYDRPARPPFLWDSEKGDCPFLAPRDERAHGTWIGLNARSGLAAITNRIAVPTRERAPSRGELVAHVLARGDAKAMARAGAERAFEKDYNGFNLLVADPERAYLLVGEERGVRIQHLTEGIHVLTNEHDLNELSIPADGVWDKPSASEEEPLHGMTRLLERHEPLSRDGFAPCKHKGDRGTRSATLISVDDEGVRFLYADGPPCRTPFTDYSPSARMLLQSVMREA